MATKTDIGNMAIGHCSITASLDDIDTDTSNEAVNCRTFFDQIRDLLFETCAWPFIQRRATLAVVTDDEDINNPYRAEWAFAYLYPADAKRINFIVNPATRTARVKEDKIPFRVVDNWLGDGRLILTDQQNAIADVNFFQTDPARFPASFNQPLSLGIAAHIVGPLKVNAALAQKVQANFNAWLTTAIAMMQAEQQDDPEPESQYVNVRS